MILFYIAVRYTYYEDKLTKKNVDV